MRLSLLALGLSLALPLAAAPPFEGVIAFQITSPKGQPYGLTYQFKGPKTRVDMQSARGDQLALITDSAASTRLVLSQNRRLAMHGPLKLPKPQPGPALTRTGRSKSILGYPCDEFTAPGLSLWATPGLPPYRHLPGGPLDARPSAPAWEQSLNSLGYFPLELHDNGTSMLAQSILKKSLPSPLFQAPAGYTHKKFSELNIP